MTAYARLRTVGLGLALAVLIGSAAATIATEGQRRLTPAEIAVMAKNGAGAGTSGVVGIFKRDFRGDARPKNLGFLIRPTAHEFDAFVQTLDKVLSENINPDFFPPIIRRFTVNEGGVKEKRGTIAMLEEWLTRSFRIRG